MSKKLEGPIELKRESIRFQLGSGTGNDRK